MPIDILAEAEAVAAARWRATEPSPGRSTEPCPPVRPAAVPDSAAAIADPRRSAHIRRPGDRPRGGAVPHRVGAGDEADPWLTRQLLRLDERLLGMLVVVAMLALIGTTVLIAVASR